jgi:hypothetical protein
MPLLRCYDSVTHEAIPDAPVVLGYVDGNYQTWGPLNARFKSTGTVVLSVTVDVKPGADVADCELGNASPADVAKWARDELHARRRPTIYGSVDYLQQCSRLLRNLRVNPSTVDWFLADYVQVTPLFEHVKYPTALPKGYVAWQFADSIPVGGHTIDASVVDEAYAKAHGYGRKAHPSVKTAPVVIAPESTIQGPGAHFLPSGWYTGAETAVRVG